MLITSNDPEVVTMIHNHYQRTMDEWAKMKAAAQQGHAEKSEQASHSSE
jgi:hypothetical protein